MYTNFNIEEYELDQDAQVIREGLKLWTVEMLRDGTTIRVNPNVHGDPTKSYILRGGSRPTLFYCYAKDEKHAVKIANERRVQLLASNLWT